MTQQDIQQFKKLFSLHLGKELTDAEAVEKLIVLLSVMRSVYSPISAKQHRETQEWRKRRRDLRKN